MNKIIIVLLSIIVLILLIFLGAGYQEKRKMNKSKFENDCVDQQYNYIYAGWPISDECKKYLKKLKKDNESRK